MKTVNLYKADFYTWANEQAVLIRAGKIDQIDFDNIAEELDTLGRSEARELKTRYRVLLAHLLQWGCQFTHRSKAWRDTINRERRVEIPDRLAESPGLGACRHELFEAAYKGAREDAIGATGLPASLFPPSCPFSLEDAMDLNFWPD